MNRAAAVCWLLLLCLLSGGVEAHQPSESYLRVRLADRDNEFAGRWDIALLDLEHAVGLDDDGDGNITWGELSRRRDAVAGYALAHLTISVGEEICTTNAADVRVDDHGDVMYAVLDFEGVCPRAASGAELRYDLLFDLDPTHRGLLVYDAGGAPTTTVLSPEQRSFTLANRAPGVAATFIRFLREGVHHIAAGYDHIAFIVLLLLPAGVARQKTLGAAASDARVVTLDILKVVTAFTIAHSLTLGLAAAGVIALPPSMVEAAIAASIILAAVGNLSPRFHARRWWLAFGFGLVHGFGFANVLGQLDLRGAALAVPLAAFNVGVEVGQLLIAAAALPLLLALRHRVVYRRWVIPGGSTAIAVLAGYWLIQRLAG
jgi:hypothetical protein